MQVTLTSSIANIPASSWDALVGEDDPFVEHAFLLALEQSGSVCPKRGWEPCHVVVRDDDVIVGALPLYIKQHSYGEFIFDWGWADASARMGKPYYPKLVSMVPVTPVTGRRLLVAESAHYDRVVKAIVDGVFSAAENHRAHSIHILFLREEERKALCRDERLRSRLSHQFHWKNDDYADFDSFVGCFRSSMRKQVRKERRRAHGLGFEIRTITGQQMGDEEWSALYGFYQETCSRKGSPPYLTRSFFEIIRDRFSDRVVASLAYEKGRVVAGTLNFEKGRRIYGRYWGAQGDYDCLHFELCYYQLIERAITQEMSEFQAGAQGTHKLRRGLMPVAIHSVHWLRDRVLSGAVDEFLMQERALVERELEELSVHGPFQRR